MKLSAIYKKALFYPFIVFMLAAAVYAIIENWNYQSEWLRREDAIWLAIAAAFVYGIVICLLALTIFLNKSEQVRSSIILSALSWFLLPVGFMSMVLAKAIHETVTIGVGYEIYYSIIANLPFLVRLVWGFREFRRITRQTPTL